MWDEIKQLPRVLISAVQADGSVKKETLPPPPIVRMRPPLLMRLHSLEEEQPQDTFQQFHEYGWRFGSQVPSLAAIDQLVYQSLVDDRQNVINGFTLAIAGEFIVRVQSTLEHPDIEYRGPRLAVMHFPHDRLILGEHPPVNAVFGGPSDGAMDAIRLIALSMNMKIRLTEVDDAGGLTVLLRPFSSHLQLHELYETWSK